MLENIKEIPRDLPLFFLPFLLKILSYKVQKLYFLSEVQNLLNWIIFTSNQLGHVY